MSTNFEIKQKKSVKQKVVLFGCLPIAGLMVLLVIFSVIFSEPKNVEEPTKQESVGNENEQKIKDSLNLVAEQKKKEVEKELKSFRKIEDEFNNNAFYYDLRTPKYTDVDFIFPYIGANENNYWLRLRFQYEADDWLFIERAILLIDGEKYTVTGNWERDNNSRIWEWLDMPVGLNEEIILDKIANSKSAKVRYEGRQYHNDRTITDKEKSIIKKTLEIYQKLK
ncbi:hypothetical protein [Capnocytophaga canimorsus]|uniref:hypothetical protein n=1 Tax=Capnocytophaga canimorsus TaxID=28188 RepID=UPI001EDE0B5A|nr:hypothetical protein [Capnocytophaga canimorsus]GJQ05230.1 hypothetical protein CAPN009_16450 [Capnocytophaga canimorsus]